jgi:RsbRD-like negative regulator of sigma factor
MIDTMRGHWRELILSYGGRFGIAVQRRRIHLITPPETNAAPVLVRVLRTGRLKTSIPAERHPSMLVNRLIQLIENHSDSLTEEVLRDALANEKTASFKRVPVEELRPRVAALYENLSKWIGNPNQSDIRQEYEDWGRTRFRQGIPFSEVVYVLILTKKHLRKFIREHGLVTFSGDRVTPDELVPVELYSIQELNYLVGDFFDRALYHLVRGYESAAVAQLAKV